MLFFPFFFPPLTFLNLLLGEGCVCALQPTLILTAKITLNISFWYGYIQVHQIIFK